MNRMRTGIALLAVLLAAGCGRVGIGAAPRGSEPATVVFSAAHRAPADAPEEWYFWTDDGVRHYAYDFGVARGPGDTVIVLHGGWGAEHSYLVDPLWPLADRYRFVLYDQRGSLRSPAPDTTIRLDRLVADLEHLRAQLGLERMTLVAHSMGGALAYAYLARHPERVRGLVLVGTVHPTVVTGGANMEFVRQVWPDADPAALRATQEAFMADAAQRTRALADAEGLLPDSLRHVPAARLDLMTALRGDDRARTRAWRIAFAAVNTCGGENWRQMRGGMAFYSQAVANAIMNDPLYRERAEAFWPALRSFSGPVRVVIGTCDYVDLGPAVWPRVVPHLRNGRLLVVQGAGHAPWLDRWEDFSTAMREALAGAR
jgi:proline iminopeptidase